MASERSTVNKEDDKVALVEVREAHSSIRPFTWGQLRSRVALFSAALQASGVQVGDRVAVVMGNSIDTLCVFLGATALGALFSSSSTDMGPKGILERLRQIEPKFVFVDDAAVYNGKRVDLRDKMKDLISGMTNVKEFKALISVPRFDTPLDVTSIPQVTTLKSFLTSSPTPVPPLSFNRVPFAAGFLIVYSSGTTGTPKCIVHSVGGVLLGGFKEGSLHREIGPSSTALQFTTTGWIMYLAAVQTLLFGAKLIMYDGSPFLPTVDSFLQLAASQGVTHLGVSPRYFSTLQRAGIVPKKIKGLETLRIVTSTGMVLPTSLFHWFYSPIGFHPTTHLANISGGTDIAGGFGDCNALLPVYSSGGCQAMSLGVEVRVYDSTIEGQTENDVPAGKELPVGEPGDLVAVKPFPNMPIHFWGDKGNRKYHDAYFKRFDNVWTHGDFIYIDPATHAVVFLGRADGVLNPSGVRFGSAEIYSVLESGFPDEIEDSICVGRRRKGDNDEAVMLFLKLKPGKKFEKGLVKRIKEKIGQELSKRHVPKFVFETKEIPTTVNGKKVELPVKRIVNGEVVKPSGTLANPESLKYYERFVSVEEGERSKL